MRGPPSAQPSSRPPCPRRRSAGRARRRLAGLRSRDATPDLSGFRTTARAWTSPTPRRARACGSATSSTSGAALTRSSRSGRSRRRSAGREASRVPGGGPRHRRARHPRRRHRWRGDHRRGARRPDPPAVALLRGEPGQLRPAQGGPGGGARAAARRRAADRAADHAADAVGPDLRTGRGRSGHARPDPGRRRRRRGRRRAGRQRRPRPGELGLSWLADPADPGNSGALLVAGASRPPPASTWRGPRARTTGRGWTSRATARAS